jgi:hypothetical protein
MSAAPHLQVCEEFSGETCEEDDLAALPENWAEVGEIIGVVYRDLGNGTAYMHKIEAGALLAAPGFLLVDSPGIRLDSRGLVGSEKF